MNLMLLSSLFLAGEVPFRRVIVDADPPLDIHCKAVGDLNGDGLADLLAASASGGPLYWYAAPDWQRHQIARGAFTTDMAVGDLDHDGHLDVVIPNAEGLIIYHNPLGSGGDITKPWRAENVSPDGARMHDVELADLDGDGRQEIVTRHQSGFGKLMGNQIHLWVREGEAWQHRTWACPHGEGLKVADVDGDGRPDVIIGARWYRNPGDVMSGEWTEHRYLSDEDFERNYTKGDTVVQTGDLNGDGKLEIVLSPAEHQGRLAWFSADDPISGPWTEHVIEADFEFGHGMAIGDVDGDGKLDIAVAKMHQAKAPQNVSIYFQRGDGWQRQVLSETGSHNIWLVDLAGDGRLSLFGANWNRKAPNGSVVELWVNLRAAR